MIGIDTNILYYSIDNSESIKHRIAVKIIEAVLNYPHQYKISLQVIAEFNYAVARKNKLAVKVATELTQTLLSFPSLFVQYSEKELQLAIHELRLFDSLLAYTHATSGCDIIYTENIKDMPRIKGVKFLNPFA